MIVIKCIYWLFSAVSSDEADKFASKLKLLNFEVSAKSGVNLTKMIYYSVASLNFFEQYRLTPDEIVNELGNSY